MQKTNNQESDKMCKFGKLFFPDKIIFYRKNSCYAMVPFVKLLPGRLKKKILKKEK